MFNIILYQWIPLFTKSTLHVIITIFANFSDIGIIFVLILLFYYCISDYISLIKKTFISMKDQMIIMIEEIIKFKTTRRGPFLLTIGAMLGIITSAIAISMIIILLTFVVLKWPFYVTAIYEFYLLLTISAKTKNEIFKYQDRSELDSLIIGIRKKHEDCQIIQRNDYLKKENLKFSSLREMLFLSRKTKIFGRNIYTNRIIITLIIFALQLYTILYPLSQGSISIFEFFIYLTVKMIFSEKILAFNMIDIVLNRRRVMRLLKKRILRIFFWVTITLYVVFVILFFIVYFISMQTVFPGVDKAKYHENNEKWFKLNENKTIYPVPFCFTQSRSDGTLQTEDFAMLTTLPRLYGINENGDCYIKPSKRGLFNSTMKYIFGREYEKDNIRIFCKKITHNPVLVITSDKILNETLKHYHDTKKTLLKSQFDISNRNYFDHFQYREKMNENESLLLKEYEECVSSLGREKCEEKWDDFTQSYWPNEYSDRYEKIPGFERYQIPLKEEMMIQPSFITDKGKYLAGTHYIVGGSYEDSWGIGFFIETICRKYIPLILDKILPFYSFVRHRNNDLFLRIEWLNRHIFYFDVSSIHVMKSLDHLLNQFNFSHESLFFVGHSISGTAFKGLSYLTDIRGITFEASDGDSNQNLLDKTILKKKGISESQMTNIYSDGTIMSGNDEKSNINRILPKRYIFPDVYDTACMTAIVCSETKKYLSFCKQILMKHNKDPDKEFNTSYESYLKFYGFLKK
ncbi:hypothetical protein M9Y10_040603 [Tritrichomonas musculus]|uniref:Fungal lipase-like domain-containing protein n=1 Tax=Tritrichomonas musculus TaxID=1915356 RepID=A0ABR2GPI1_9EUKA